MPWPDYVTRTFEHVPLRVRVAEPSGPDFHGPYNKLLHTLFPWDTKFTVVPRRTPNSCKTTAGFLFFLEVVFDDKPVLVVQIKPPSYLGHASGRNVADRQIRDRMKDIQDECPLEALHAVSAMGTRLCFYRKHRDGPIHPPSTDPGANLGAAPVECWDCDILEEDGVQRFKAVVDEIKQGCDSLA